MEIQIVTSPISFELLTQLAEAWHKTLIKGVVDVETGVLALGGEWHIDGNSKLIEYRSSQKNLWGFNLYPNEKGDDAIEYNSLINVRPGQNNRTMVVEDVVLRKLMREKISKHVTFLEL